ncbi:MAG: GNAT family N-acetyltransferase [Spartobacteria bacterium]
MNIRQATLDDLDQLVPLFDSYRQFYKQPSDLALARSFLRERLTRAESVIFLAFDDQQRAIGFTQLYPSFSSVLAARLFILNDLFVHPDARRSGAGVALLHAAADFGRAEHAVELELSTAVTNHAAQALYEREGWRRDQDFYVYRLGLLPPGSAGQ